ncbi:MAG: mammalian cell entry protein [Chitinophagaceae bacterium]|nr:MAG: mammalian cell entry protein [Chitinophagaceae bacterium]
MAEHADSEQLDGIVNPGDTLVDSTTESKPSLRQRLPRVAPVVALGLLLVATVGVLAGWLGFRAHAAQQQQALRSLYVQTARQAALNLTTISYTEADADIRRILDSTTGAFRDDFQRRAEPFVAVVKQARSKSEGTVTEAGLESVNGDGAQVLLAVSVRTSLAEAPAGPPRNWRMRISVAKDGAGARISNVQFVS